MATASPKTRQSFLQRYELDQRQKIDASMSSLVLDERFADFMMEVASLRESALDSLNEVEIIKSDRATLAVISEASAFKKILNIYEDKRAEMLARQAREREMREQDLAEQNPQ